MSGLKIRTRENGRITLDSAVIESLSSSIRGDVLTASDAAYDDVRAIWNAMIDRRPAMIVRCSGAADVVAGVRFAAEHELLLSVRGGGHNIAGNAVCDGGMMLDLSPMRWVHVDPLARTARVGPGATLGDLDRETQLHGLATPVGINSTTGVAGLTLGGGFGWLTRKYGLTVDNLMSADVVTADGKLRVASEEENADLFWGIRGGGGNFGVVTSFEFRLHEVGPEVLAGLVVYPFDQARSVFDRYREFVAAAPDELSVWVVLRKAPPLPFLPEEVHGAEVMVLAIVYAGDVEEGEAIVEPLKGFGTPAGTHLGPVPFAAFQTAFDPLLEPGARNYWKSHDFRELSDGAIETMLEYSGKLPSPDCEVFVGQLGGAMSRVPADATAYPNRDVEFIMNVHGRWDDAADDERCIGWARELFQAVAPHATGSVYVNFMTEDEQERVAAAYGPSYQRLVELKGKYDPDNLFRMNQNIRPAAVQT